jgi:RHS repeat-associated protein
MVVDRTGSLSGVKRHDYFPFGEEIPADMNWRTNARGYVGDTVRQKFTSYERDYETNMDFAQARYYANAQGRFTSVDPLLIDAKRLSDPQELNIYAYARNNPLKFIDPSGMEIALEGKEQKAYITDLNNRDNHKFATDSINDKVKIVDDKGKPLDDAALKELGKTLSGGELELFKAITDNKVTATIDTGDGQPNDKVDFGGSDMLEPGGKPGRNTLDMSEMKLLDAPENKGGMSSGNAVAHETLEAYATAQRQSWPTAHAYATKYFGEVKIIQFNKASRVFGSPNYTGTSKYEVIQPNKPTVTMEATLDYNNPRNPQSGYNINKVKVVP